MEQIIVTGIVFFFTYKIIELAILQRGRKQMLQKMSEISPEMFQKNMNSFNAFQNEGSKGNRFLMLRLGGLALGIGLGWLLGLPINEYMYDSGNYSRFDRDTAFIATTAICAGVALIIVYLIERKAYNEAKKGE
jgi:hypothetical protein